MLIIFLPESNGASPQRGNDDLSAVLLSPSVFAHVTSAASVGSPVTFPSSSISASQHSAIALASSCSFSPKKSTTVILFCVSVPVLSEQMTCAQPRVSTAVRRRIIALRFDMLVTPMDKTTVTTAASPSGMAATASDTRYHEGVEHDLKAHSAGAQKLHGKYDDAYAENEPCEYFAQLRKLYLQGRLPVGSLRKSIGYLAHLVSMPVAQTIIAPRP